MVAEDGRRDGGNMRLKEGKKKRNLPSPKLPFLAIEIPFLVGRNSSAGNGEEEREFSGVPFRG